MQNMQKQTRKRTTTYNPLWWVVGFGALFVLICGLLWLGKEKPTFKTPVGIDETRQLILHEEKQTLSEADLALAYNPHNIVLSHTTYERASHLAILLGANLSYEGKLNFGILALPIPLTIDEVLKDATYKAYWSEMDYDYYTCLSDASIAWPTSGMDDEYYLFQDLYQFINMGDVWDYSKGEGVTIAIIDTGIDYNSHQFDSISTLSYNASTQTSVASSDLSCILDEQGHGTIVAEVVAASDDGKGIVGIAPNVTLLIIKANCNAQGNFNSTADLVRGIRYAVDNGADIINMSFCSPGNSFASAISYAALHGVICVGASGNDSVFTSTFPAADSDCISVGAFANGTFDLAGYSNFGHNDICAPGTVYARNLLGEYEYVDGTSFAAPIVAGALALYLSLNPTATREEAIDKLLNSASDVGALGKDYYFGCGALNVSKFINCETYNVTLKYSILDRADETFYCVKGQPMWTLPTPEDDNLVFGGWYYDEACTQRVSLYNSLFKNDTVLYAKWGTEAEVVPYTYVITSEHEVEIREYVGKISNSQSPGLVFPDEIDGRTVVSIAGGALNNRLTMSVSLPNNLMYLDPYFMGTTTLVLFEDYANNVSYLSSSANSRLCLYSCKTTDNVFVVSNATRIVFANAFTGATYLQALDFGQSVVSIGDSACEGLKYLYSVNMPSTVQKIGKNAFKNCTQLSITSIPYGITRIEPYTFYNCQAISSFSVPNTVTSIGEAAFARCSSLVSCSVPSSVTQLPQSVFYCCSQMAAFSFKNTLERIDSYAFAGCTSLDITGLSTSLKYLGPYAFNATKVKDLLIPGNVSVIPVGLCYSATALKSFDFQGDVYAIGESAFAYCVSLLNATIPYTVCYMQKNTFKGCISLRVIEFSGSSLPEDTVIHIPEGMCDGCSSLIRVKLPVVTADIGASAFFECSALLGITNLTDIETIGEYAFYNCSQLEGNYTLSEDCTDIPGYCFANCSALTKIEVSPNTEFIGEYAFYNCSSLTNAFDFSATIYEVGSRAFYHCPALKTITLWEYIGNFDAAFRGATGLTELTIPSSVTEIAGQAFDGCTALSVINIADTVETIGQYAFNNCSSLTEVYIPNNVSLQMHAFNGCNNLEALELPLQGRTLISYFDGNFVPASLSTVIVNDSVDIAPSAFKDCKYLVSVTLCDDIQSIGFQAFNGCCSLRDIILPASLNHVGRNAFLDINEDAFSYQGALAYLGTEDNPFYLVVMPTSTFIINEVIHKDAKLIGEYAISNMTTFVAIYLPRGLVYINENAFYGNTNLLVYVPCTISDELVADLGDIETEVYHTFSTEVIDPTLDEEGYTLHTCDFCPYAYSSDYIAALRRQPLRLVDKENIEALQLIHIERVENPETGHSLYIGITAGATVAMLRQCFRVPSVPVAEDADGNIILDETTLIKTGMTMTVYDDDNSVIDQVIITVKGDVSGDGNISITDLLMVQDALLEKSTPNEAGQYAANVNGDSGISITDLLQILDHLLEVQPIE